MDKPIFGDQLPSSYGFGFADDSIARCLLSALRYGPLSLEQFAKAAGVSYDHVRRTIRKRLLRDKLAADVKVLQQDRAGGRPPTLMYPTQAGYDLVCDRIVKLWGGLDPEAMIGAYVRPPRFVDWRGDRKHRLATIDVMIDVEKSALAHRGACLQEIIPEYRPWNGMAKPTSFRVDAVKGRQSDLILLMRANGYTWAIAGEADLGTETVCAEIEKRIGNSIEGKARSYWHYLASGRIRERLAITEAAFQVAFVTTSERRARYMCEVVNSAGLLNTGGLTPADVFYFTTFEASERDFFGAHWLCGAGDQPRQIVKGV